MKELADNLIGRFEVFQTIPVELVYIALMLIFGLILLFGFVALSSGFNTYLERRISARMQSRVGCNRVGPEGLLQFALDGLKLIMKEDIIPTSSDKILFRLAPYLVFMGSFMSFAVIPFTTNFTLANLNIGIFYLLSIASVAVVGILMSGWSSNNKWALLGAVRSTAQIISYEIPVALCLLIPVLLSSTLNMTNIAEAQKGGMYHWFINPILYPFGFIGAIVFFIASLSEINRTPFDLPEAESELVSGFNTEYSGIRFGIFFVAEFANITLAALLFSIAFLGGYTKSLLDIPFGTVVGFFAISIALKTCSYGWNFINNLIKNPKNLFLIIDNSMPVQFPNWLKYSTWVVSFLITVILYKLSDFFVLRILFFIAKAYMIVFIIMWIRWTLPRYRIDQLMALCWKKLVPIAFISAVGTAFLMVI